MPIFFESKTSQYVVHTCICEWKFFQVFSIRNNQMDRMGWPAFSDIHYTFAITYVNTKFQIGRLIQDIFCSITKACLEHWIKCWYTCIVSDGSQFEGNEIISTPFCLIQKVPLKTVFPSNEHQDGCSKKIFGSKDYSVFILYKI